MPDALSESAPNGKTPANYTPLSPLSFLKRAARVYPNRIAVIHGATNYRYSELYARCRRLASALRQRGIGPGDTVSILSPNIPAMLEAHYGIPMNGSVVNTINTRLDGPVVGFILDHAESKAFIVDSALQPAAKQALEIASAKPLVIDIADPEGPDSEPIGELTYEALLGEGNPEESWSYPEDEWAAIALNYTSGTTGNPKGVVYHHRGAYLNAMGAALGFGFDTKTRYLWTLPMFHCNGWSKTWGISSVCGTHICLRDVVPEQIFARIAQHKVTHMAGAPVVLNMLVHAPAEAKIAFDHGPIEIATGGAAPPSTVIARMQEMGFHVKHLYGLTETYGPSTECVWQSEWDDLPFEEQTQKVARQGVNAVTVEEQRIVDPVSFEDVPHDAETIGEIVIRSNSVMKGYLKNRQATEDALGRGWFRTGDLAVVHPDSYAEIKDRAKDIIISGGENISSLEVEEALYRHPKIMEAAVVALPHPKWGETPCAFVTPIAGAEASLSERDVIDHCRERLAHFKCPTKVVFGPLPKTSTGKIQKFELRARTQQIADMA